ncbi:MAG: copper chaperone PCu(A)C [Rhodospirillales bacterium]
MTILRSRPSRTATRLFLSAVVAVVSIASGSAAFAHAFPRGASPAADSTVAVAPNEVTIRFSESLEPRFSSIAVIGAGGERLDSGPAYSVGGDGKRLGVAVRSLPPGAYKVVWQASSVDTHQTDGEYAFTVAASPAPAIGFSHVWARASAGPATTAAVYFTAIAAGTQDRLIGARTPIAAIASLHGTIDDRGVMKMRPVENVAVAPDKPVLFEPGGYHVMLEGLREPLKAGAHFPLTLVFERAGPTTVDVVIEPIGTPAMHHGTMAGH